VPYGLRRDTDGQDAWWHDRLAAPRFAVPIADGAKAFNADDVVLGLDKGHDRPRTCTFGRLSLGSLRALWGVRVGGVMTNGYVKKRCFICVGGYEPIGADWWHERTLRELKRFETTWNVTSATSPVVISEDSALAGWKIETKGPNWRVETDYCLLRWDDFVSTDFARSKTERVPRGIATLADFIFSGTAYRYLRTSFRYFLFFIYPIVLLAGLIAAAVSIPYLLSRFGLALPGFIAMVGSIAAFIGLLYWPGRFLMFDYMLDDWIFAGEFIRRTRPGIDERIDRFARELVERAHDRSYDEIVLAGQSLGGAWIIAVADHALKLDPQLGKHGPVIWLMSTGSSLLKVALHPKAEWIRQATSRVVEAKNLNWVDYQAIVDVISFYGSNPAEAIGLEGREKPIVQKVRMRKMLETKTYKRFWGNFFRLHRQFVMGNELRYFYDYLQICCGPAPLADRVALRDRLMELFTPDGAYEAASSASAPRIAGKVN
jgi:hypothetical protein